MSAARHSAVKSSFRRIGPEARRRRSSPFLSRFPLSEDERADIFDLSVGGRLNVWRDTVFGFANAIVALNDDGVRSDVIPTVGLEATF
jgi:hypothetical protein